MEPRQSSLPSHFPSNPLSISSSLPIYHSRLVRGVYRWDCVPRGSSLAPPQECGEANLFQTEERSEIKYFCCDKCRSRYWSKRLLSFCQLRYAQLSWLLPYVIGRAEVNMSDTRFSRRQVPCCMSQRLWRSFRYKRPYNILPCLLLKTLHFWNSLH
jgi:hypothetical protein